jgi:glucosamine-6-phosphate deaminase
VKIVSLPDSELVAARAADAVIDAVVAGARTLLLATGRSPMRVYEILAERTVDGGFATDALTIVQLDEYWGLTDGDERRLDGWLDRSVIDPWGIDDDRVIRFDTTLADPETACKRLSEEIDRLGGIDLALLGLGPNGHLGFNEPPSSPSSPTRAVTLTAESIESNGSYWGGPEHSPRQAVTVGLETILASEQIMVVVTGDHKQDILHHVLSDPPTPEVPASYLQEHARTTVYADQLALP